MSYQEYARFARVSTAQQRPRDAPPSSRSRSQSRPRTGSVDRPYTGSMGSFSIPRQTPPPPHSSSSSTSSSSTSSLSPSNSASQKGALGKQKRHTTRPLTSASRTTTSSSDVPPPLPPRSPRRLLRDLPSIELDIGAANLAEKPPNLVESPRLPYRPFYLHRRVLVALLATFVAAGVALEALLDYSHRNSGIMPVEVVDGVDRTAAAGFAWRLASPLVAVALVVAWSRVEYQAKLIAPWMKMNRAGAQTDNDRVKGEPAGRTLLVDYMSGWAWFPPWVIAKAVWHSDWMVACVATVGALLRVVVVLAAGVVSVGLVRGIGREVTLTATTEFVPDVRGSVAMGLADAGVLSYYTMVGKLRDGVEFPEGTDAQFAFQRFDDGGLSAGRTGGSMTIVTTVEGFSATLDCESATVALAGVGYTQGLPQFNTSFSGSGCNVSMPIFSDEFLGRPSSRGQQEFGFGRIGRGRCGDSAVFEDQRVVVVYGRGILDLDSLPVNISAVNVPVRGSMARSAALLCKPNYAISRVNVQRDGDVFTATPSGNRQTRTIANLHPWELASTALASFSNPLGSFHNDKTPWFYEPDIINVDAPMALALDLRFSNLGQPPTAESLLEPNTLMSLANDYFREHTAQMASRALMRNTTSPIAATASAVNEKLVANPLATHLIVGLLAVSVVLAFVSICMAPGKGFLPRDPGALVDLAALVANSRNLLQALRGAGGTSLDTLRQRLAGTEYFTGVEMEGDSPASKGLGTFRIFGGPPIQSGSPDYAEKSEDFAYPFLLHPLQRVAAMLIMLGLIIGLDFSLQASNGSGGLGDVNEDPNGHFRWTVAPTLIFGLVVAYLVSTAFMLRVLAPFAALRRGSASFEDSINLNMADKTIAGVLFRAFKTRNLAVGGAAVAAVLASLVVVISPALFSAVPISIEVSCRLQSRDFFATSSGAAGGDPGSCPSCQNGTVLASLVLNGNISYPAFTYEDMAFPGLSLLDVPRDLSMPEDVSVAATLPAVRPFLSCRAFPQSQIATNVSSLSPSNGVPVNPLRISLAGEPDSSITVATRSLVGGQGRVGPSAYFGTATWKPMGAVNGTLSRWIFVWGQLQDAGTNQTTVRSVSALACNETMEQVSVSVQFVGATLAIDPRNPPVVDQSTAVPAAVDIDGNLDYSSLVPLQTSNLLDPFFASLTSSRFAVPVTTLGDNSQPATDTMVSAITRQHRLVRAQVVSALGRRPTIAFTPDTDNANAAVSPLTINPTTGAVVGNATSIGYPATLTIATPLPLRLIQDSTATRLLQALLATALLATIISFASLPRPNLIPRLTGGGLSIASQAALLADGNMFGLLGRGAEWRPAGELRGFFRDGLHVTRGFNLGWEEVKKRRREETLAVWGMQGSCPRDVAFGVSAARTGGWGGGENVGLGMMARVGFGQRGFVRDWGWRT